MNCCISVVLRNLFIGNHQLTGQCKSSTEGLGFKFLCYELFNT